MSGMVIKQTRANPRKRVIKMDCARTTSRRTAPTSLTRLALMRVEWRVYSFPSVLVRNSETKIPEKSLKSSMFDGSSKRKISISSIQKLDFVDFVLTLLNCTFLKNLIAS